MNNYNVLFLCTGNSARSLFAECALTRWGGGRFQAFSAGSHPQAGPHPLTLQTLKRLNYETAHLHSKSWDEFAASEGPPLHFVFTVCDKARAEVCPVWPGQPMTAHWGVTDPAAYEGPLESQTRLFERVYFELENRIKIFASLPFASLDALALQRRLDEIGPQTLPSEADPS
jgi:arsenate reductase